MISSILMLILILGFAGFAYGFVLGLCKGTVKLFRKQSMETFIHLRRTHPDKHGELEVPLGTPSTLGCCGIAAVAAVAKIDYPTAFRFFRPGKGRSYRGGTTSIERFKALKHFGVQYNDVTPKWSGKRDLAFWATHHSKPDTVYLVTTHRHAQVVWNGYVLDQTGVRPIAGDWTARREVRMVLEISNADR